MRTRLSLLLVLLLASFGASALPAAAETKYLSVPPRRTAVTEFHWARVAEMLLIHYRFPDLHPYGDYACGLAGLAAAGNTGSCNTRYSVGSLAEFARTVERHQQLSAASSRQPVRFFTLEDAQFPRFAQFRAEIDRDRPLVMQLGHVRTETRGANGKVSHVDIPHFVLVTGYDDGRGTLLIADPVDYPGIDSPLLQTKSPPAREGQHWIRFNDLADLGWAGTYVSRPAGSFGVPARGQDRWRDSFRDKVDGREPRFGSIYYKDSTQAR